MKKKILAGLLCLTMLSSASSGFAVLTEDDIDYSSSLSQIESLMKQCDSKGISYDYEMVNYQTIKRFDNYLKSDIGNGVDDTVTTYNKAAVDALCAEAIENLTAYANGTKTPKKVTLPDMTNAEVSGAAIKDDENHVFSIGYNYGHLEGYDMNSLGVTNFQLETGPSRFWDFTIPFGQENVGSADASALISVDEKNGGSFSMKVTNHSAKSTNVYTRFYQTVPCKPSTTYNYGISAKYTDNSTNGLSIVLYGNGWEGGAFVNITDTSGWNDYSGSFTTGSDQTSILYQFIVEGEAVAYFDDMYLTESGTALNLLKNGDIEGYSNTPSFTQDIMGNAIAQGYVYSGTDVHGGSKAFKVVNNSPKSSNVYVMYTQTYPVKPDTTYEVGTYAKFTDTSSSGYGVNVFGNDWWTGTASVNNPSGEWELYAATFTTSENQTSATLRFLVEGDLTVYFDDMYVKEQGTGENLIINGDFENARETGGISEILRALEQGEQYNLGASVLISPHYFPTNIDGVTYCDQTFFLDYDIGNENARTLIEAYIRALIPLIKDYPALQNICITNEPFFDTDQLADIYNPKFRTWLESKYGTISALNTAYALESGFLGFGKTTYDDWSDIVMSDRVDVDYLAMGYDWNLFNTEVCSGFHTFMAEVVKEYTDIPLSAKELNFMASDAESGDRTNFNGGVDPEILAESMDLAGCDAWDYYDDPTSYYETMMWYDFLHSVTEKPAYNSETHIIRDGNDTTTDQPYTAQINSHVRNDLWMSGSHGLSMASIWLWSRSYDNSNVNYESLMTRPDVMAGIGHTALDMSRLSEELGAIHNHDRNVAIFYSAPSRILDGNHMLYTYSVYKALVNLGIRPGFVTERSLDKLSEYDAVILAGVSNATSAAVTALANYSGAVLKIGDAMTKNEYNQSQSVSISGTSSSATTESTIAADVASFVTSNELTSVVLKDADGNSVSGLDWSYYMDADKLLVNVTNLDYGTTKNIHIYLNGNRALEMSELITGTENLETASLAGLEPQLLKVSLREPSEITDISFDSSSQEIVWDYTDGIYNGVNIYKLSSGEFKLIATVASGTSYAAAESGTYAVKSVDDATAITDTDKVLVVVNTSLTLSVSNIRKSGNTVSGAVQTLNNESGAIGCVVKFEVLDSENNIINYHYQTLTIKGGAVDSFTISLPVTEGAAKVRVSAIDSKTTNNNVALTIIEEL